jgi:hypothetical protein
MTIAVCVGCKAIRVPRWEIVAPIPVPTVLTNLMDIQPILLFVDETYLSNGTGQVQTVVPVPLSTYRNVVVPECQRVLGELGPAAREFKGGKIRHGNQEQYKRFLRLFRNLASLVAEHSPLRTVITLDGAAIETGEPFLSAHRHVALALGRVGITDCEQLARAFSRKLVWLKDHFEAISVRPFSNPLVVTFDNKYRYSDHMQRQRAIQRGATIHSFRKLEDVLTVAANCLLDQWKKPMVLPPIEQLSFRESASEFGLQAADLFSNLYYNLVLSELGHSSDTVRLKADLCRELLPSIAISDELRSRAALTRLPDGQTSFQLLDANFGMQAILGPAGSC